MRGEKSNGREVKGERGRGEEREKGEGGRERGKVECSSIRLIRRSGRNRLF